MSTVAPCRTDDLVASLDDTEGHGTQVCHSPIPPEFNADGRLPEPAVEHHNPPSRHPLGPPCIITSVPLNILTSHVQKAAQVARLPDLESQRDHLQHAARRLTERIRDLQRSRDAERETATEELAELRREWAARTAELQEELGRTTSLLNIERAKVDQSRVVITELDAEARKWEAQASRYKKKVRDYHVPVCYRAMLTEWWIASQPQEEASDDGGGHPRCVLWRR